MVEAREVLCTDPYVIDDKLISLEEAVDRADIIVLGAPHAAYRDLHFFDDKIVVDVWGFWPHRQQPVTGGFSAS
jgi:UDP-N-acetyl-D-mannosaminuronic acid dehydrogenase